MKKHALLIGMDKYLDAGIHNLRYAVEDARLMANALANAGFETRFLHDAPDQRVVRTTQQMVAALGPEDLFLLYFSGHGVSVRNRHLLLCEEAQHRLLQHGRGGVWVDELKDATAGFGGDRVFILDSCRDALLARKGAPTKMGDVSGLRTLVDENEGNQALRPGGLTILCSCDEDDTAQESEVLGQGLFSRALLGCLDEALQGSAELRLDGSLTATLACRMGELAGQHALAMTQRPWVQTCGVPPVLVAGAVVPKSEPPRPSAPPVGPPRRRSRPAVGSWWVVVAGEERGPLDNGEVEALIKRGLLSAASECWRDGMADWEAMGELAEWREAFPKKRERPRRGVKLPPTPLPPPPGSVAGEATVVELPGGMELEIVWCPPGQFVMGSPGGELGRFSCEGPQHRVRLASGFWLGKFPVTQSQWESVTGETPSSFKSADRPVERVSWDDCQALLRALNSQTTDGVFRLPSESQWEYACRAGTTSALYTGEELTTESGRCPHLTPLAWHDLNSSGGTQPVGLLVANAWGLHDMLGNVWEWCADEWHDDYDGAPGDGAAWKTSGKKRNHVNRGGTWDIPARDCRSACRRERVGNRRSSRIGLRLALSPAVH